MKSHWFLSCFAALSVSAAPTHNTATPGGKLPKPLKVSLVQVASGFVDPVRVTPAPDGSNRLFVCERTGVVRLVKDGKTADIYQNHIIDDRHHPSVHQYYRSDASH